MNGEKGCGGESDTGGERQLQADKVDKHACRSVVNDAERVISRW